MGKINSLHGGKLQKGRGFYFKKQLSAAGDSFLFPSGAAQLSADAKS